MQRVGVLGSGTVGQVLADGFLKHGYAVMRGSRDPGKLSDWSAQAGSNASTGTFAEAAGYAEIVVLAVKGEASMFICGNDAAAKSETARILTQFGWATEDMGGVEAARALKLLH